MRGGGAGGSECGVGGGFVYLEFVGDVRAWVFNFNLHVFECIFVLYHISLFMCIWGLCSAHTYMGICTRQYSSE
jgi:hypothetical protein